MAILLAILSIVAAVTPVILDLVGKYMASKEVSTDALIHRDIDDLRSGLNGLQQKSVSIPEGPTSGPTGPKSS
jgi:hypothetical protein